MFLLIIKRCRGGLSVELSGFEGREDLAVVVPASRWKKYSNRHRISHSSDCQVGLFHLFPSRLNGYWFSPIFLGSPAFSLVQLGFKLVRVGFILTLGKGGVFDHLSRFLFAFSHCLTCTRVEGVRRRWPLRRLCQALLRGHDRQGVVGFWALPWGVW